MVNIRIVIKATSIRIIVTEMNIIRRETFINQEGLEISMKFDFKKITDMRVFNWE